MKKSISFYVAVLGLSMAAAGMAHATKPGNNGGGNGGCGVGQTTNGCGGSGSNTATGGAGGNGYGGTGVGVGVGVGIGQGGAGGAGGQGGQGGRGGEGGSVWGSGNSSNVNANTNKQAQGQQQGQAQSSRNTNVNANANKNSNRNDNRSQATGGNSNATGGASHASNSNSNANSGNNSDQSVTVNGDSYDAPRIPVATAYAAPLAASNGTCMGSSSAGFQGMAVGISLGTTWNDESCDMRYDAEALRLAGMPLAAVARLCQKSEIADAMKAAGTPCPGSQKQAATAAPVAASAQASNDSGSARYSGNDPIVRARLGLPPLK